MRRKNSAYLVMLENHRVVVAARDPLDAVLASAGYIISQYRRKAGEYLAGEEDELGTTKVSDLDALEEGELPESSIQALQEYTKHTKDTTILAYATSQFATTMVN